MDHEATLSFAALLADLELLEESVSAGETIAIAEMQSRQSEIFQRMLQLAAIKLEASSQTN
jgi:hypothetical protein